jgi:branched-chain amino acid transport system substrate-binding protein
MVITTVGTPDVNNPQIFAAAQASAKQINSTGGLKGHQITVLTCNDQLNPNVATQCAEKAVQDHVMAVVGTWSTFSTNIYPVLQKAGIPMVGTDPITAADTSNAASWPVSPGIALQYIADGVLAAQHGCKIIAGVALNQPANLEVLQVVQLGADSVKPSIKVVPVYITFPQPDYAPVINQAISDNADCLTLETSTADATRIMTAIEQSGHTFQIFANDTSINTANLKAIGSPGNGKIFEASPQALPNSSPSVATIVKDLKKQDSQATLDSFSLNAWAATQVLKLAAAHMTSFTPQALTAALPKTGTINLGYYAPFNFNNPVTTPGFTRLFNTTVYGWVAQHGQYVPLNHPATPINIRPILSKL